MRITAQSLGLELANALATLVISETPPLTCPISPPYTPSPACLQVGDLAFSLSLLLPPPSSSYPFAGGGSGLQPLQLHLGGSLTWAQGVNTRVCVGRGGVFVVMAWLVTLCRN